MEYIVYTKETCPSCEGKGFVEIRDAFSVKVCHLCNGRGIYLNEVDLKIALEDIFTENPNIVPIRERFPRLR